MPKEINGSKHLVAYYVPAESVYEESALLAHHLKSKLPEYMVPSAFVAIDHIPLTPNGKVDRKLLAKREVSIAHTTENQNPEKNILALNADHFSIIQKPAVRELGVYIKSCALQGSSI